MTALSVFLELDAKPQGRFIQNFPFIAALQCMKVNVQIIVYLILLFC